MHGAVLLDKNGKILRPAILWNDGRSGKKCEELEEKEPDLKSITDNLAMPGFTASKLLWTLKNEPEIFKKIHKVLLPQGFSSLQAIWRDDLRQIRFCRNDMDGHGKTQLV